jgi:UDP-N-acetylmuramoyl-L-alanyl-D-glutamate--2,6-diaminopimelate ligase
MKVTIEDVAKLLPRLKPITGRMTLVDAGQPFAVIVDFAHTPDSFAKLLPEIKDNTPGTLIVVFGSAGERDTKKRPIQGKIASEHADIVILADEDPRGEEPMAILVEIADGCIGHTRDEDLLLIPDRRDAIAKACSLAGEGDTILLLGKGHETSIAYAGGEIPWNEEAVARDCLKNLGYT